MNSPIPFFSLERQWSLTKSQIEPAVKKALDSNIYIGGPFVKKFEEELADFLGAKHVVSCNSGTDALWLALKALDIQKDSIVITTPFSFIASCSEIIAHNAHPVLIDIDENTFNISPQKIEKWLEENTTKKDGKTVHNKTGHPVSGMIVVNLFGQCADFEKIKAIAKDWNLWIVEDAAQSIGSSLKDQKAGTLGDISTFSFYPTKNLGACGDGGATTTNNPKLAERLLKLHNHGRQDHYNYTEYGLNSRLDGIQAAILSEKLKTLNNLNQNRRNLADLYRGNLKELNFISLPQEKIGHHTYHQFCIQIKDPQNLNLRDKLAEHLSKNKIGYNIYFPKSFTDIEFLQTDERLKNICPITKHATKTILALPIWPELKKEEIDFICAKIKEFFLKQSPELSAKKEEIVSNI